MKIASVITTSNVNYSGAGKLKRLIIKDTPDASGDFDATIAINIDGIGATTLNYNDWALEGTDATHLSAVNLATSVESYFFGPATAAADQYPRGWQINMELYFSSSLVINLTNANAFVIIYDKDVF